MADSEHVAMVKRGAAAIEAWRVRNASGRLDLSEADLSRADLTRADLSRADLVAANLVGADLIVADLIGADLSAARLVGAQLIRANLRGASLRGTNLNEADLRGADLSAADLSGADLIGADLSAAKLVGANLSETDLRGANLKECRCGYVVFGNVDLSEVMGLDSMQHEGPSTVGIDTLFKSKGKIPEAFLRGAGVPEILIEYLPSLRGSALEFYSCFISYSHSDEAFARRLHDALQVRGIRCWLDEHQLLPGDVLRDQISEGIQIWDKVLFCGSQDSLASWWVDKELTSAFAKEEQLSKALGKKVLVLIPLNLDGSLFSWEGGWADEVKSRLAADFTGWEGDNTKFERQLERVTEALRSGEAARPRPPVPKLGKEK